MSEIQDLTECPIVARKMWEQDNLVLSAPPADLPSEKYPEWIRESARKAVLVGDRLGLFQGELLYEIHKKDFWRDWGYPTFDDYISRELEFKTRKAYYLIGLYEKFVVELGLPLETLAKVPWSKAKEIVSIITKENAEEMIRKISVLSLEDIKAYVKLAKGGKPKNNEIVSKSFKMTKEQSETVETALRVAGDLTGSTLPGQLLELICADFLSGKASELEPDQIFTDIANHIKVIEQAYGVKLEIKETNSDAIPKLA